MLAPKLGEIQSLQAHYIKYIVSTTDMHADKLAHYELIKLKNIFLDMTYSQFLTH